MQNAIEIWKREGSDIEFSWNRWAKIGRMPSNRHFCGREVTSLITVFWWLSKWSESQDNMQEFGEWNQHTGLQYSSYLIKITILTNLQIILTKST
jgi:hypothetical protein